MSTLKSEPSAEQASSEAWKYDDIIRVETEEFRELLHADTEDLMLSSIHCEFIGNESGFPRSISGSQPSLTGVPNQSTETDCDLNEGSSSFDVGRDSIVIALALKCTRLELELESLREELKRRTDVSREQVELLELRQRNYELECQLSQIRDGEVAKETEESREQIMEPHTVCSGTRDGLIGQQPGGLELHPSIQAKETPMSLDVIGGSCHPAGNEDMENQFTTTTWEQPPEFELRKDDSLVVSLEESVVSQRDRLDFHQNELKKLKPTLRPEGESHFPERGKGQTSPPIAPKEHVSRSCASGQETREMVEFPEEVRSGSFASRDDEEDCDDDNSARVTSRTKLHTRMVPMNPFYPSKGSRLIVTGVSFVKVGGEEKRPARRRPAAAGDKVKKVLNKWRS